MNDIELISKAIEVSKLSVRRFAIEVLGVEDRSVWRWMNQNRPRPLPGTVRIVCRAIITRPGLAFDLVDANMKNVEAGAFV